ncbi:MAG: hypothetical protein ABI629_26170 [bacterium]
MRRIVLLLIVLLPLALACGCAAAPHASGNGGRSAVIVGRLLVYRGGRPLALTRSETPLDSALYGDGALTSLTARNLDSGARFSVPISDERGWFRAALPPGAYAIGVGHYIWLFDTPARFQTPAGGGRCYVGTLGIDLFARSSLLGNWARLSGGAIPETDNAFQVLEQPGAAQRWAGQALASCSMQLLTRPAVAAR